MSLRAISDLLALVAGEGDARKALHAVTSTAIDITQSRHALIAFVNQSQGHLEIVAGSGEDFHERHMSETLPLDVGQRDGIVGYVAATGSAVITGNVRTDPHYKKLFAHTQSEMALPIRDSHGRIRGVLNVESDRRDAYADLQREAVVALANVASLILEREDHEKRERALIDIGTSLDSALNEEALIEGVIRVAEDVLRFQACSIFLVDAASETYVLRGTVGNLKEKVGSIGYKAGEGFTGWVCQAGEPIMLDDPQSDPRWRGKYVEFPSEQIASFLAVPISSRGKCIGVIRVLRKKPDNQYLDVRFDSNDLRLLQAIAEQVAVGLDSLRGFEKMLRGERMIAWGELSAKSSHMIGNRVFALKGDINELGHLLGELSKEVGMHQLKSIREVQESLTTNVTRVEEILQDFRDFVSATQIDREPADLNQIVAETLKEVFPRRSSVELQVDLDSSLPPLQLDAKRMRRAISELIENSLNYMEAGQLRVCTRKISKKDNPRTRTAKASHFAELEIEDTGPGVGEDQKSVIFQPFLSKRVKGMGLGLSIVKGIIDAHGGHVYESGDEGSGARFVILLPI